MKLEIVHNDKDAAWGHCGPIVVVMWKTAITADALERFVAFSNPYGKQHATSGWAVLSYPTPRMELPSQELRKRITELTSNPGEGYLGTTTVVDADGFAASVMRSILAGFALMGGKGAPRHVSKNSDEAVEYLGTLVKFDVEAMKREMRAFVAAART